MSAQPKTSDELADMLTSCLNVTGVKVGVEPDPVDGWHPVIVAARSSADKYQQLADEVERAAIGLRAELLISSAFTMHAGAHRGAPR